MQSIAQETSFAILQCNEMILYLYRGKNMQEHGSMNIDQQKASYDGFVKLFTYSTIALVVLMALMAATLV